MWMRKSCLADSWTKFSITRKFRRTINKQTFSDYVNTIQQKKQFGLISKCDEIFLFPRYPFVNKPINHEFHIEFFLLVSFVCFLSLLSNMQEYAESAMNELLGWYGYCNNNDHTIDRTKNSTINNNISITNITKMLNQSSSSSASIGCNGKREHSLSLDEMDNTTVESDDMADEFTKGSPQIDTANGTPIPITTTDFDKIQPGLLDWIIIFILQMIIARIIYMIIFLSFMLLRSRYSFIKSTIVFRTSNHFQNIKATLYTFGPIFSVISHFKWNLHDSNIFYYKHKISFANRPKLFHIRRELNICWICSQTSIENICVIDLFSCEREISNSVRSSVRIF